MFANNLKLGFSGKSENGNTNFCNWELLLMKITWVFTEKWCTVLRNIPGLKVGRSVLEWTHFRPDIWGWQIVCLCVVALLDYLKSLKGYVCCILMILLRRPPGIGLSPVIHCRIVVLSHFTPSQDFSHSPALILYLFFHFLKDKSRILTASHSVHVVQAIIDCVVFLFIFLFFSVPALQLYKL